MADSRDELRQSLRAELSDYLGELSANPHVDFDETTLSAQPSTSSSPSPSPSPSPEQQHGQEGRRSPAEAQEAPSQRAAAITAAKQGASSSSPPSSSCSSSSSAPPSSASTSSRDGLRSRLAKREMEREEDVRCVEDLAGKYEALRHADGHGGDDRAAVTFPSNFDRVVQMMGDVATGGAKATGVAGQRAAAGSMAAPAAITGAGVASMGGAASSGAALESLWSFSEAMLGRALAREGREQEESGDRLARSPGAEAEPIDSDSGSGFSSAGEDEGKDGGESDCDGTGSDEEGGGGRGADDDKAASRRKRKRERNLKRRMAQRVSRGLELVAALDAELEAQEVRAAEVARRTAALPKRASRYGAGRHTRDAAAEDETGDGNGPEKTEGITLSGTDHESRSGDVAGDNIQESKRKELGEGDDERTEASDDVGDAGACFFLTQDKQDAGTQSQPPSPSSTPSSSPSQPPLLPHGERGDDDGRRRRDARASDSRGEMREPPQTAPSVTVPLVVPTSGKTKPPKSRTRARTRVGEARRRQPQEDERERAAGREPSPKPSSRGDASCRGQATTDDEAQNPIEIPSAYAAAVDTLQDIDSKLAALRDGREMDGGSVTDGGGGGTGRPATVDALLKQIRAQTARGESQADSGSGHCGDSRPVSGSETETGPMARDKSRLTYPLRPKHVRQKEQPSI